MSDIDDSDHGYFSDADLAADIFDNEFQGYISDFGENEAFTHEALPVLPVSTTTLQPPVRPLRARPTTTAAPVAASWRRRRGIKRLLNDSPSSPLVEDADAEPAGCGTLSSLDEGRGFALLAANPDIPKDEFVASLISSNPHLFKIKVEIFFYNCHKRTRFPKFVRDYFASHREHLESRTRAATRASLSAVLQPLYVKNRLAATGSVPVGAISMWGKLVLREPAQSYYSTEIARGMEFLRLSRAAQVDLFTQLWHRCGSPPMPPVVSAVVPSPIPSRDSTQVDRIDALELLAGNPSMSLSTLVDAFVATHPGRSMKAVRTIFRRYRGWTAVPAWMHETISQNAHLARTKEGMKELIRLVLKGADTAGRKWPYRTEGYIRAWIKFCVVVVNPAPAGEPCEHHTTRGGVFVRMPENIQKAFFESTREQLIAKSTNRPHGNR